jgi:hypothetical protein
MNIRHLPFALVAALVFAIHAVDAAGENRFTPFSLSWGEAGKHAGKVGERQAASIAGAGTCANVQVDWGDGSVETAGAAVFQGPQGSRFQTAPHAYARPGRYTLKVWDSGPSNCGGQAIVITVGDPTGR